ncbi:NAD(P)-binding protein [Microthyrium microscopicum]|uniref:NAD(P)-binding protein n=1 Tax=Microthyrium microscopicum TaxID=703497 RepID=A0A6A6U7I4_9PEZI|nr:NAD(P)-binding protein [Microthyrium microscopicum]
MASKLITIIAGVGPGTGAAVARKFAESYPVVLLARNPDNFNELVKEINGKGGKALGISTDISDPTSVSNAFAQVKKEFGDDVGAAAAIFNASGGFVRKPFLELALEDISKGWDVSIRGGFLFSQQSLALLLRGVKEESKYPPTLIHTGATASVKANAQVSAFNTGKYALRALSSSLAKEFGPQGVHVGHAIIDGGIDSERARAWKGKDAGPDALISPEAIADAYWHLHTQPRSAFTWEIDIRPSVEKW